jgi:type II secretory pathway component PulJ
VRRLHEETGFTLIEVLVSSVLMIAVLGTTLGALSSFETTNRTNQRQNDAQDHARNSLDLLARNLRNLASPTNQTPEAVVVAEPDDLVFQTVDRTKPVGSLNELNTKRARYCLNGSKLYLQEQTWTSAATPDPPATDSCPGPDWPAQWGTENARILAQDVVNGVRPLFVYNAAELDRITAVHTTLFIDVNPGSKPTETTLESGVFLRNQNRFPNARFTLVKDGARLLRLNASTSDDPEGKNLEYRWYDATTSPPTPIGEGVLKDYNVDIEPLPGVHRILLKVTDPAELEAEAEQEVSVE